MLKPILVLSIITLIILACNPTDNDDEVKIISSSLIQSSASENSNNKIVIEFKELNTLNRLNKIAEVDISITDTISIDSIQSDTILTSYSAESNHAYFVNVTGTVRCNLVIGNSVMSAKGIDSLLVTTVLTKSGCIIDVGVKIDSMKYLNALAENSNWNEYYDFNNGELTDSLHTLLFITSPNLKTVIANVKFKVDLTLLKSILIEEWSYDGYLNFARENCYNGLPTQCHTLQKDIPNSSDAGSSNTTLSSSSLTNSNDTLIYLQQLSINQEWTEYYEFTRRDIAIDSIWGGDHIKDKQMIFGGLITDSLILAEFLKASEYYNNQNLFLTDKWNTYDLWASSLLISRKLDLSSFIDTFWNENTKREMTSVGMCILSSRSINIMSQFCDEKGMYSSSMIQSSSSSN